MPQKKKRFADIQPHTTRLLDDISENETQDFVYQLHPRRTKCIDSFGRNLKVAVAYRDQMGRFSFTWLYRELNRDTLNITWQ